MHLDIFSLDDYDFIVRLVRKKKSYDEENRVCVIRR